MGRFAILIEASDIKGQTYLNGAKLDVVNLKKYLGSPLGGDWDSYEIIACNKPSTKTIHNLLTLHEKDYCFVAFSGHGFFDSMAGVTRVCLNDNEQGVDIADLKPKGRKGVLLVDACRGEENGVLLAEDSRKISGTMSYQIAVNASSASSNSLWFNRLNSCPDGIVTMYSCSKGESAGDNPNAGGLYTTALVSVATKWSNGSTKSQAWYSTKEAHDDVVRYLSTAASQQNPQYFPAHLAFPWAVK